MNNSPIISGAGIRKSFTTGKSKLDIIKGIDISARKGEALFIVGPSGAGKSTLLHILGGLEHPDSGEVLLSGENIYRVSKKAQAEVRNEKIGFVFQMYHLLCEFTALENVMLPGLIKFKGDFKESKKKAQVILSKLGLSNRLNHRPGELSGGEQQRVAMARALINSPLVLFCDEPTGNLDSKNSSAIYGLLLGIKKEDNLTLVVVTHQKDYSQYADRILGIKDGILYKNVV